MDVQPSPRAPVPMSPRKRDRAIGIVLLEALTTLFVAETPAFPTLPKATPNTLAVDEATLRVTPTSALPLPFVRRAVDNCVVQEEVNQH